MLIRQGYQLTPHPELSNGELSKPDFLVKNQAGEEFYLEAIIATQNNETDNGEEQRKGVVLDKLSEKPHRNFIIVIDDEGNPKTPPSSKKLIKIVHSWLDSLDPDKVNNEIKINGLDSIKPLLWQHDGWNMVIRPIPLKPDKRNSSTNLIGTSGLYGGWIDSWSPIRNAIKFKGGKYGELDKPFVVAVNINSFNLDRIDEMQALYGEEQLIFQRGGGDKPRFERAPNGAWYGKKGPQYKRVSAAWIFNDLHVSSLANRNNTIYLNPWANYNLPESLTIFPHAVLDGENMKWVNGLSIRDVFELYEGWPEQE